MLHEASRIFVRTERRCPGSDMLILNEDGRQGLALLVLTHRSFRFIYVDGWRGHWKTSYAKDQLTYVYGYLLRAASSSRVVIVEFQDEVPIGGADHA